MEKNLSMKTKKKVFIIAEVGVNHNGSLKRALKLIDKAVLSEKMTDAVKFQTFQANDLVTKRSSLKRNIKSEILLIKKRHNTIC